MPIRLQRTPQPRTRCTYYRAALTQATRNPAADPTMQKKPEGKPGLEDAVLNRIGLRDLAKCLSCAGLEGLSRRKRNFLSQHCELLGLLAQHFELLA